MTCRDRKESSHHLPSWKITVTFIYLATGKTKGVKEFNTTASPIIWHYPHPHSALLNLTLSSSLSSSALPHHHLFLPSPAPLFPTLLSWLFSSSPLSFLSHPMLFSPSLSRTPLFLLFYRPCPSYTTLSLCLSPSHYLFFTSSCLSLGHTLKF